MFEISRHARDEAAIRGIPLALIEQVLDNPEQMVPEKSGRVTYQSRIRFEDGKEYLIRVVVAARATPPVVVTVYRTSKISKYWR